VDVDVGAADVLAIGEAVGVAVGAAVGDEVDVGDGGDVRVVVDVGVMGVGVPDSTRGITLGKVPSVRFTYLSYLSYPGAVTSNLPILPARESSIVIIAMPFKSVTSSTGAMSPPIVIMTLAPLITFPVI